MSKYSLNSYHINQLIRRENRKENEGGKKRREGGKERKKWRRGSEIGMMVVARC